MTILRRTLATLRTQIIAYGLGLGSYAAVVALLFNSMSDTMLELEASYPDAVLQAFSGGAALSLATPSGFLTYEYFSFAPLFFAAFAVFASTGALAGEEGSGTLEFLGALPLSRRRIFIQKALALLVAMGAIAAIICIGWALTLPFLDLEGLTLPMVIGATFAQISFLAFVAAVGLLLGAVAPSRGAAAAWTGAIAVVAFLAVSIAGAVDAVSWLQYTSPFYYADFPAILVFGITPWHFALVWGATLLIGLAALRAFEGREIGSERWQLGALAGGHTVAAR